MEDIILSVGNLASRIVIIMTALIYHPVIWGFFLGLLASTLIHLYFLMTVPPQDPPLFRSWELFRKALKKGHWYRHIEIDYTLFRVFLLIALIIWLLFLLMMFIA